MSPIPTFRVPALRARATVVVASRATRRRCNMTLTTLEHLPTRITTGRKDTSQNIPTCLSGHGFLVRQPRYRMPAPLCLTLLLHQVDAALQRVRVRELISMPIRNIPPTFHTVHSYHHHWNALTFQSFLPPTRFAPLISFVFVHTSHCSTSMHILHFASA